MTERHYNNDNNDNEITARPRPNLMWAFLELKQVSYINSGLIKCIIKSLKWGNRLPTYQIWGFNLVPYSGLSDLRVSIKLCRLSIGAVTPNWLNHLVLYTIWPIVFTKILTSTISPYIFVVNSPINDIN